MGCDTVPRCLVWRGSRTCRKPRPHLQLRVVDVSEKEERKGRPHGLNTGVHLFGGAGWGYG